MKDHFYLQNTEKLLLAWRFAELKLKPTLEKYVGEYISPQLITAIQCEIKSVLKAIETSHPNPGYERLYVSLGISSCRRFFQFSSARTS